MPELRIIDHHTLPGSPAPPALPDTTASCLLDDLGVLEVKGPDARQFLQGQLSNDLARLVPDGLLRAGLHNPQGRTLALPWLLGRASDDILALLPLELVPVVAAHLRRYVLRAKLTISDVGARYRIYGLRGEAGWQPPAAAVAYGDGRALLIQSADAAAPDAAPLSREQWRALDIAAGLPQVHAATAAQFVAQMLNLDCIDAISFTKGCYTGQEVIARAHYRGRVKRRMQRFETSATPALAPGDTGRLQDGRAFSVIESALRADGRREFLAVAPLIAMARESAAPDEVSPAVPVLLAAELALPYPLPD